MSLELDNPSPAYRLGRLFAVFEKIQEEANPGVNTTRRQFGAASTSPVSVFPILNRTKNRHLAKFENRGRVINFERLVGAICDTLDGSDPFPPTLSLADQGRFAVGYYHQRERLFTKPKEKETTE